MVEWRTTLNQASRFLLMPIIRLFVNFLGMVSMMERTFTLRILIQINTLVQLKELNLICNLSFVRLLLSFDQPDPWFGEERVHILHVLKELPVSLYLLLTALADLLVLRDNILL